uniref:AMP-dependent synthetase/ligase domain-containing protein n=1 Tax=Moorena producens (strain JHB) TaxID=1454205 RepID=A0A1D9G6U9_MOOP1
MLKKSTKAGGAYIPFDLGYPQERLAYILSDSQVSVVLTSNTKSGLARPQTSQLESIYIKIFSIIYVSYSNRIWYKTSALAKPCCNR